jgi:hypothetical protein
VDAAWPVGFFCRHSPLWIHIRKLYPYKHLQRTEHLAYLEIPAITIGASSHMHTNPYETLPHEHLRRTESSLEILAITIDALSRMHTYPYEYTYANPTPMSTSEGLSTRQIWRFPKSSLLSHWVIVDGNNTYHLTHNAGKSCTRNWTLVGSVPLDHSTIELQDNSSFPFSHWVICIPL